MMDCKLTCLLRYPHNKRDLYTSASMMTEIHGETILSTDIENDDEKSRRKTLLLLLLKGNEQNALGLR